MAKIAQKGLESKARQTLMAKIAQKGLGSAAPQVPIIVRTPKPGLLRVIVDRIGKAA